MIYTYNISIYLLQNPYFRGLKAVSPSKEDVSNEINNLVTKYSEYYMRNGSSVGRIATGRTKEGERKGRWVRERAVLEAKRRSVAKYTRPRRAVVLRLPFRGRFGEWIIGDEKSRHRGSTVSQSRQLVHRVDEPRFISRRSAPWPPDAGPPFVPLSFSFSLCF